MYRVNAGLLDVKGFFSFIYLFIHICNIGELISSIILSVIFRCIFDSIVLIMIKMYMGNQLNFEVCKKFGLRAIQPE